MEVSHASFDNDAEVDCGNYQDGEFIRYRVSLRKADDLFQVYRYDHLPIDFAGNTHIMKQGTLEECAEFVIEKFNWQLEYVETFKCEVCSSRSCVTDAKKYPEGLPTKCMMGELDSALVKWRVVN